MCPVAYRLTSMCFPYKIHIYAKNALCLLQKLINYYGVADLGLCFAFKIKMKATVDTKIRIDLNTYFY